jgi:hypothetical protein
MKKILSPLNWLIAAALTLVACDSFLKEDPKTFLNPESYYQNEKQALAAVNGVYTFLDDIFDSDVEPGSQNYIFLEFLHGYGERARGSGTQDLAQANSLMVAENNGYVQRFWESAYRAIENCNSIIEGIEGMAEGTISEAKKNQFLGEVYFLRGYFYFNLVRLYGPVPLKLTPTRDLSDTEIELSSMEEAYNQIDADMVKAGELMENLPWTSLEGRVTKGTVKAMHAKVLLTMGGYPLQKGAEYFAKAYNKAKEVYNSGSFYLFDNYNQLRSVENSGEIIWSLQREADNAGNPLHFALLPYPAPAKPVSASPAYGGAVTVTQLFLDSYPEGDRRAEEQTFYYSAKEALDGSGVVEFDRSFIYKYWDQNAAVVGKSGANFTLLRYADLLLVMAEAKARADGGTTSDGDAINAYYAVRSRALPGELKPSSITADQVLKERFWELAFENQTWFDMVRSRKALHVMTGEMVELIGYQTPGHTNPFTQESLLLPYPIREKRLNPNLTR